MAKASQLYEEIYALVRLIPPGKVANYGQIAEMHGGCGARQVGYALNNLRNHPQTEEVPWQRVINARGEISLHGGGAGSFIQRELLEAEGVEFGLHDRIDLTRFRWEPALRLSADDAAME
jgi:methylated-DNA-protein-cysteine methyltransferase-like protein